MSEFLNRYISDITEDEFEKNIVLPFVDNENNPCILIKNKSLKIQILKGATAVLAYHLNTQVEKNGKFYYVHIISCVKNDEYSKEQFSIVYKYLFKEIKAPLSSNEVTSIITSLSDLFKISSEKNIENLRSGVYGELLFVYHLYKNGYEEILNKYHKDFFSKHDIEISDKLRIEIKSSIGQKRIHRFSHDQIQRTDIKVYVGSMLLEPSEQGKSLLDLFNLLLSLTDNPLVLLSLAKLKAYCGISSEDVGPLFAFDRAIEQVRIFDAALLPHLNLDGVQGISKVKYDVDCSFGENIDISSFVSILKANH